jgi:hypothetical protein
MGMNMTLVQDPMQELANSTKCYIKQKIELLEMLTGCETANRYNVYSQNSTGHWSYLFKCKEQSGWCVRNCISSESRPFNLCVKHVNSPQDFTLEDYSHSIANFERPYKCTCCCLAR